VDAKGEPLKATSYMAVGFYVAKYVNKKSDMDLAAKGLGAKEWNRSLKTKLSLLPEKLVRIRNSRNFGMKMLTMTNLSTECLTQLTKLRYDAKPLHHTVTQHAHREPSSSLERVTASTAYPARPGQPAGGDQGLERNRDLARLFGSMGQLRRPDLLDLGGQPAESDRVCAHYDGHLHERPGHRNGAGPAVQPGLQQFLLRDPVHAGADAVHGYAGGADLGLRRRGLQQPRLRLPGCHPGRQRSGRRQQYRTLGDQPGRRAHAAHLRAG